MVCISNFTAECGIYFEHSVDYNGKAYLVIYGYHADGNFVFLPNQMRGCTVENDFQAISEKIIATGIKAGFAKEIENHIYQWKSMHQEEINKVVCEKIESSIKNSKNF